MIRPPRGVQSAGGFTFVELLITLVFLSIAILAVTSQFPVGLAVSESAEDLTVCTNLAQEMLEEIRGLPWKDPYSGSTILGPDAGEFDRVTDFDDVDDYNGLVESPPVDLSGNLMNGTGTLPSYGKYARSVTVSYVDPTTMTTTGSVTGIKRVDVTVTNTNSGQATSLFMYVTERP